VALVSSSTGGTLTASCTSAATTTRSARSRRSTPLAQLVASGNPQQAATLFNQIAAAAAGQGVSLADLNGKFPTYNAALSASATAAGNAASATTGAAGATNDFGVSANLAAQKAANLAASLRKQQQDAQSVAQSFLGLGSSVNDAKTSLSGWIHDLAAQAEALHNFRKNAEEAAHKGLDEGLIRSLEKAGPEGALRMKQLANGTKSEIDKANSAWESQIREMRKWVAFQVPPKQVTVDARNAKTELAKIQSMIDHVHGKTIVMTTEYQSRLAKSKGLIQKASGGYITGPGTGTSDSIPARLSNGEFVVNAATTARLRPWLEYENAKGFAAGGAVGGGGGGSSLRASVAQMFGSATWDGWTRSELRSIAAADKAAASLEKMSTATLKGAKAYSDAAQQAVDAAKAAVQAARDHTQAIRDDITALKQSVAQRFQSDQLGDTWQTTQSDTAAMDWFNAHPDQNIYDPGTASIQDSISGMRKETQSAKNVDAYLAAIRRTLRRNGVSKKDIDATISYLAQSGSELQDRALWMDPKLALQFEQAYTQRQRVTSQVGDNVAMAQYGKALSRSEKHQQEAVAALHSVESKLDAANQRIHHLETAIHQAATEVASGVTKGVNGAVTAGYKKGHR